MLRRLDLLLRDLLRGAVPVLGSDDQVRFQAPDAAMRTDVVNVGALALSVYLVDVRENRKLRSNDRARTIDDGVVFVEQLPARVDCHYLITAWSPALPGPMTDPVLDEHELLYDATVALLRAMPLNPAAVYRPPLVNPWPIGFGDVDLPTVVLPAEGFPKLSEFWTSMGQDSRWKPAIYLVVTIPVVLVREPAGPMVTTSITGYARADDAATREEWIQIGGHVLRVVAPNAPFAPVPGAWVRLETLGGAALQLTETNELGRFTFDRIRAERYRLRTGAAGFGEQDRVVDVPLQAGDYDLVFP